MMHKSLILGLICLLIAVFYKFSGNSVIVRTPDGGKIIGSVSDGTPSGRQVYQFYNIPYTRPPTGERRFRHSELVNAHEGYNGTLDARTNTPVSCIQAQDFGMVNATEDCLVLTVLSPDLSPESPLPVIFWIHGGGLVFGANHIPGYTFTENEADILDAVIVKVNYRLAYLGFLQLEALWETEKTYGNYGIRDQITALKWVHTNIRSFGGDPDSVTIIGESAGATSVLSLLSSPLANNLFHRAVALSPGPEMRYSYKEGGRIQGHLLTENKVKSCENESTQEDVLKCLRDLSPYLFTARINLLENGYFQFPMQYGTYKESIFMVYTDPDTIPLSPKQLKHATHTPDRKVKVIISNAESENTILRFFGTLPPVKTLDDVHSLLNVLLRNLNFTDKQVHSFLHDMDNVYKEIQDPQYLYELLTSDIRSTCPINDLALEMGQSEYHDIYRLFISTSMAAPPHYPAYHVWDTDALFDFISKKSMYGYTPGPRDLLLRDKLRHFLKNFIRDDEKDMRVFPDSTTVFGNGDVMVNLVKSKPREAACELLKKYNLDIYGAQN